MDIISLPVIDKDAHLRDAIALMKKHVCTAVLVQLASGAKVIELDLILHALRKRGNVTVANVPTRVGTVVTPKSMSASKALADPKRRTEIQELMDSRRALYAMTRATRRKAEVVSRHETFGYVFNGIPAMWECPKCHFVWMSADLVQPGNLCRDDKRSCYPV